MIFHFNEKEYQGSTAIEVVRQIARDDREFSKRNSNTIREFIAWSLKKLGDELPPRELDLNNARVSDEMQAQSYLSLRHDFGIGRLVG